MRTQTADLSDDAIAGFLRSWTDTAGLDRPGLLAGQILVGTHTGTTLVDRDTFLGFVRRREDAVDGNVDTQLVGWTTTPVGTATVLVTATWTATGPDLTTTLTSAFLLQPAPQGGPQCSAYLPRQDLTTLVAQEKHPGVTGSVGRGPMSQQLSPGSGSSRPR